MGACEATSLSNLMRPSTSLSLTFDTFVVTEQSVVLWVITIPHKHHHCCRIQVEEDTFRRVQTVRPVPTWDLHLNDNEHTGLDLGIPRSILPKHAPVAGRKIEELMVERPLSRVDAERVSAAQRHGHMVLLFRRRSVSHLYLEHGHTSHRCFLP